MGTQRQRAESYKPTIIADALLHTILSGPGVLRSINATGTVLGTVTVTIDGGTAVAYEIPANDSRCLIFDAKVTTSLTVQLSAATLTAIVTAD